MVEMPGEEEAKMLGVPGEEDAKRQSAPSTKKPTWFAGAELSPKNVGMCVCVCVCVYV
jgi:hypothetical protein